MPSQINHSFPEFGVELIAHQGRGGIELLISLAVPERERDFEDPPAKVVCVIDRSGSMAGEKISMARSAVAQLIRSLRPVDQIGVIAYDHRAEEMVPLGAPSEHAARQVDRIQDRGNTNLYGGWLAGVKMAGRGGRVILLSDGLANEGRFTDATSLGRHAGISYREFEVATTTIGVGNDYDEAIMAAMARQGGGVHYFARNAQSIVEAFSNERFGISAEAVGHVEVNIHGTRVEFGQLWAGETKVRVTRLSTLGGTGTVSFRLPGESEVRSHTFDLPGEVGNHPAVEVETWIAEGALIAERAFEVRTSEAASVLYGELRKVVMNLLQHPLADELSVKTAISQFNRSLRQLDDLQNRYDEAEASTFRKQAYQRAFNLQAPGKAFSSFDEDRAETNLMSARAMSLNREPTAAAVTDPRLFSLATPEMWRSWVAIPLSRRGGTLRVLMANPRDMFLRSEMESRLGLRIEPDFQPVTEPELLSAIDQLELLTGSGRSR